MPTGCSQPGLGQVHVGVNLNWESTCGLHLFHPSMECSCLWTDHKPVSELGVETLGTKGAPRLDGSSSFYTEGLLRDKTQAGRGHTLQH